MADNYRLWYRKAEWEYDAPGHVYMMRAAEQIGGALGTDWKGVGDSGSRRLALESIREHCAYGRLTAAAMIYDGTFKEVPAHRWNTVDCWKWFPGCTITNFEVFGSGIHPLAGVSHYPLYLTESSLQKVLRVESAPASAVPSEAQPTREQLEQLLFDIVQSWRDNSSADEYRVTREDFHALAVMCWAGTSSEDTREVFKQNRPEKWGKPGPFPRKETDIKRIAGRYGIPRNYA